MKNRQLIFFLGLFLLFFSAPSFSQKKVLTDEEEVTEMVTKEMDELFKSKDFLKQKDKKFKIIMIVIINNLKKRNRLRSNESFRIIIKSENQLVKAPLEKYF